MAWCTHVKSSSAALRTFPRVGQISKEGEEERARAGTLKSQGDRRWGHLLGSGFRSWLCELSRTQRASLPGTPQHCLSHTSCHADSASAPWAVGSAQLCSCGFCTLLPWPGVHGAGSPNTGGARSPWKCVSTPVPMAARPALPPRPALGAFCMRKHDTGSSSIYP